MDPCPPPQTVPTTGAPKRKQYDKAGRDKCWRCGASGEAGILKPVAAAQLNDARLALRVSAPSRRWELPASHNRLCAGCYPELPGHPVLGVQVAAVTKDNRQRRVVAEGVVQALAAGQPIEGALFSAPRLWNIEWHGSTKGPETMSTDDIGAAAELREASDRRVQFAVQRLRDDVARSDRQQTEQRTEPLAPRQQRRTPASPEPPPPPPAAPEPLEKRKRLVRIRLPPDAEPGAVMRFTLPADFLRGSPAQPQEFCVPPDAQPGQMLQVELWVAAPLRRAAPPAAPSARGRGPRPSKELCAEARATATAAGLQYDPQPNPLNPVVAWPIRPCFGFHNLQPGYFGLPARGRLFKAQFGFSTWDDALFFFRTAFPDVAAEGVPRRAIIAPFFQYLAALWRLRADELVESLAAFFGVPTSTMCHYLNEWIPRLGNFAKMNLVYMPKMETITALMPQSFIDCKMDKVVLVGDCKDHLVEQCRTSLVTSADQHSSKSDASVAMGLQFCTPIGHVAVAADLVFGRASELNVCAEVGRLVFKDVPMEYSIAYDKGVAKLRLHLPNLNQVLTPCFIRGAARYTIEQGIYNRGVTCNRYIVEVVFARETEWRFLGGVCRREDFHLLNPAWWWALGFQNLVKKPLKPPAM